MSYRPFDITYPSNYPGSDEIPLPSGILLDMVREIGPTGTLRNLIRSNGTYAWGGSRVNVSTAAASFDPPKFTTQFTGYRNPITTSSLFDTSTIGLQIIPQLRNNKQPEPVIITVPYVSLPNDNGGGIKLAMTVVCENGNNSDAGAAFAIGFAGVDANGIPLYIPPYNFDNFYDLSRPDRDVVFNINPDFRANRSVKYIISWLPASGLDFRLRCVELFISDTRLDGAKGSVLISCVGVPNGTALSSAANLTYGSTWDFIANDPQHVRLAHNPFRYEDLFSDKPGSANGDTGAKKPWMLFLRKSDTADFGLLSYHTVMQVRPEGDVASIGGPAATGNYEVNKLRMMVHPFIPDDMFNDVHTGYRLSIHRMPLVIITSITVKTLNNGINLDISRYSTGVRATAESVSSLSGAINDLITAPVLITPNQQRVKGHLTIGSLCNEAVLEKHEVTPWVFYDSVSTYGVGVIPGLDLTSSFSSFELKGHNSAESFSIVTSTTPPAEEIRNQDSSYRVDFTVNGNDAMELYPVNYLIPVWNQGLGAYVVENDPSIRKMPLDPNLVDVAILNGGDLATMAAAASFAPMGLADRFYSTFIPQGYRFGGGTSYPILDASTPVLRASGFINNYSTAGALSEDSVEWVFSRPVGPSSFPEPYGTGDAVINRGSMNIVGLSGPTPDLSSIPEGTILFSNLHVLYLTYTPDI